MSGLQNKYMAAVTAAIVVAGIYFGRSILVPLALAILLAFALAPLVEFLRRLRFGRVPSVMVSVAFAVFVIGVLGTFIGTQFARLAADLPHYQTNLSQKIQSIKGSASGDGVVERAVTVFKHLSDQVLNTGQSVVSSTALSGPPQPKPLPVVIEQPRFTPLQVIENVIGPLLDPLATTFIVMLFVIFILLQKEDLRDRFIRLAGSRDLQLTTTALDDAASRLSRYLLLQTIVNATFGTIIGVGLWLIGVPNPGLWGLVAGMFRFVPYIGVPVAAVLPVALSIAVDPGWSKVIWTLGLFTGVELVTGNAIEPWLYGRNTGLSAIAIVVSAAFWTWLWGPVGLLLSTPLTMCLVVVGKHVEALQFLDVLLGDQPPLAVEQSFYLRMLAGDPDEAAENAESYLRQNTLADYYDEVAMRALVLAQRDAQRGALDADRIGKIKETIRGLIENLAHHDMMSGDDTEEKSPLSLPEEWQGEPVLCVAGRNALDEAAGMLFADVLRKQGIGVRVVTTEEAAPANIQNIKGDGVRVFCTSYLEAGNFKSARYLVRRLRKYLPHAMPVAAFWGAIENDSHYLDSIEAVGCDLVVTNMREAVDCIIALSKKLPVSVLEHRIETAIENLPTA